jgi:hypothetical protein
MAHFLSILVVEEYRIKGLCGQGVENPFNPLTHRTLSPMLPALRKTFFHHNSVEKRGLYGKKER